MTPDELLALNPYPGLRAFAVSEADLFFGRQRQVDELVERLHASTLVAVAGASGCGKSSLVLAGLLHELAQRHVEKGGIEWRPVVMRPGNRPISNLASALAASLDGAAAVDPTRAAALDGRLRLSGIGLVEAVRLAHLPPRVRVVVVVDQFEEIFRFRRMTDQDESAAFVKLLLHAAFDPESPVSVVLTLRSDTLGYCADFRDLPEAVSRGQYLVPRLTRDQRKNAIVGPVELRGFRVAPRLVQRVLNDVSDDFDDLPVMQHALSRTWRRWATACAGSRPIDVEDYEAIGAAANALSMHADEAYDALTGQGAVVEKVFRALTERVAEGTEVRRPMQFDQLCAVTGCDRTAVAQVVERYRQGDTVFLLPAAAVPLAGNPVIDISHESLIRNWKRLKQWTDREAQSAQMIRRLFDAAGRYATQTEGLLRDPALQFALDWRERNQPTAPWAALYGSQFERTMQFLDASRDARDQERLAARRAARNKLWTGILLVVASLAFGGVMYFQYRESEAAKMAAVAARTEAEAAKRVAEDERARSRSRQLALLANSELSAGRLDRALLLGVAAMHPPTEEAQDILRVALRSAPRLFLSGHRDEVSSVAFAPDGTWLASASQDGDVIYWDPVTGKTIGGFGRESSKETDRRDSIVAFGSDGTLLASPNADGVAVLLSAANEQQRAVLNVPSESAGFVATVVAVDPDHRMIALARGENNGDDVVSLWDTQSGRRRAVFRVARQQVSSLAFRPDGGALAAGTSDGSVRQWDLGTGRATALRGRQGRVNAVAYSPDGKTLASGGSDQSLILWDARTGQPLGKRLEGHRDQVDLVAFSPDGRRLASSGWDNVVFLWDVATRKRVDQAGTKHRGRIASLAFSRDGALLASGSLDGTVVLWDAHSGEPIGPPLKAHHDQVRSVAFSPDGRTLASAGRDNLVILWDVAGGKAGRPWRGPLEGIGRPVTSIAFSRDRQWLVSGHEDGGVYLWKVASATPTSDRLGLHEGQVTSVAFSPDSRTIASAGEDRTVRLWDVATLAQTDEYHDHQAKVTAVAFSPDGRILASGSWDKTVILRDLPGKRMLGTPLRGHQRGVTSVAFSADGKWLASGGEDNAIKVWDPVTGAWVRDLPAVHGNWVTSVAFNPADKAMLASGSRDQTLRLWDVAAGKERAGAAMRAGKGIWTVAFSDDGRTLASGGLDSAIRLWDVATRAPIGQPIIGHRDTVYSAAFSPDGRTLASGSGDGSVMLWDTDVANWPERACAVAGGDIDPEEWPKNIKDLLKGEKPCAPRVAAEKPSDNEPRSKANAPH